MSLSPTWEIPNQSTPYAYILGRKVGFQKSSPILQVWVLVINNTKFQNPTSKSKSSHKPTILDFEILEIVRVQPKNLKQTAPKGFDSCALQFLYLNIKHNSIRIINDISEIEHILGLLVYRVQWFICIHY